MPTAAQLKNLALGPTSAAGKLAQQRNIESGHLARMRNSAAAKRARKRLISSGHLKNIACLGGEIAGRLSVESGQLLAAAPNGGRAACHVRHHLKKNKINTRCAYCTGDLELSGRAQRKLETTSLTA